MSDRSSAPSPRRTARVILHDGAGRVWLIQGCDPGLPERAPFWFTPGGKIEPGETAEEAACRELLEETGLALAPADMGPVVGTEAAVYRFQGVTYDQVSVFYAVQHSGPLMLDTSRLTQIERQSILTGRWWTRTELAATTDEVFPAHLGALMDRITAARDQARNRLQAPGARPR